MLRIASHEYQKCWRQLRRSARVKSLNTVTEDGNRDTTELIEMIADDRAVDLDTWLDNRT